MSPDRTAFRRSSRPSGPRRHDVASQNFLDFFTLVGVHLQDPADALLLAMRIGFRRSRQTATRPSTARRWADRQGSVISLNARAENFSSSVRWRVIGWSSSSVPVRDRWDVQRRRQEVDDGVEHALHALFLKAVPQAWLDLGRDGALTDRELLIALPRTGPQSPGTCSSALRWPRPPLRSSSRAIPERR